MKRFAYIVLAVLAFSYDASAQKLTILHLNDTHSHIEPERVGSLVGQGGTLERAAYIDSVRTADGKGNVLLLRRFQSGLVIFHASARIRGGGFDECPRI